MGRTHRIGYYLSRVIAESDSSILSYQETNCSYRHTALRTIDDQTTLTEQRSPTVNQIRNRVID